MFGTLTKGLPSEGFTVVLEAQFPTLPATLLGVFHLLSLMKASPQQHPVLCIEGKSLFSHFLEGQCGLNTVALLSVFPHFGFLFPGSAPFSCLLTLPSFSDSLALTTWA